MDRTFTFALIMLFTGLFALLNWDAFTAFTTLSVAFATVQAPLGLIMLALVAFLCVLFALWVISMQASVLIEARRQARELQLQRDIADKAEASRFAELRTELLARLDRLQEDSRRVVEQGENAVAAHIGEFADRLERAGRLPPSAP